MPTMQSACLAAIDLIPGQQPECYTVLLKHRMHAFLVGTFDCLFIQFLVHTELLLGLCVAVCKRHEGAVACC